MANLSAPADPFQLRTILLQTDGDKLAHFYVYQLVGVFRQSQAQFYIIKYQQIVCLPPEFNKRMTHWWKDARHKHHVLSQPSDYALFQTEGLPCAPLLLRCLLPPLIIIVMLQLFKSSLIRLIQRSFSKGEHLQSWKSWKSSTVARTTFFAVNFCKPRTRSHLYVLPVTYTCRSYHLDITCLLRDFHMRRCGWWWSYRWPGRWATVWLHWIVC